MLTLLISLPENTKRVHQCIFNTLGAAAGFLMKKRTKFAESKPASQPSDSDCHTLSPTINFFTIHAYCLHAFHHYTILIGVIAVSDWKKPFSTSFSISRHVSKKSTLDDRMALLASQGKRSGVSSLNPYGA